MTGLHLQPAQPPADRHQQLQELSHGAQDQLASAHLTLARIRIAADDALPGTLADVYYSVELWLAEQRVHHWQKVLDAVQAQLAELAS